MNNPYQAPMVADENPFGFPTLCKAFGIVIAMGFGGAVLGGIAGWLIEAVSPSYFPSVFSNDQNPNFDPVVVGKVTGIIEGAGVGIALGVVMAALFFWFRFKAFEAMLRNSPSED